MSDVYETLFLGKEAYEATKFSQKNVRTIIRPVGSGTPDPLDEYGKIGWKASIVAAVLDADGGLGMDNEMVAAVLKWRQFFDSI